MVTSAGFVQTIKNLLGNTLLYQLSLGQFTDCTETREVERRTRMKVASTQRSSSSAGGLYNQTSFYDRFTPSIQRLNK